MTEGQVPPRMTGVASSDDKVQHLTARWIVPAQDAPAASMAYSVHLHEANAEVLACSNSPNITIAYFIFVKHILFICAFEN